MVALGIIGFLAVIICIILLIWSAIKKKTKRYWAIGIGISFILFIVGMASSSTPTSAPTPAPTTTPTPAPTTTPTPEPIPTTSEIVVTAATLYSDYQVNSVAADQKYKGKLLQVTGAVTKIDTDILGNPTVTFGMDSYNMSGVLATFKKSELNNVANISLGQTITIIGTGHGELIWTLLDDCYMKN